MRPWREGLARLETCREWPGQASGVLNESLAVREQPEQKDMEGLVMGKAHKSPGVTGGFEKMLRGCSQSRLLRPLRLAAVEARGTSQGSGFVSQRRLSGSPRVGSERGLRSQSVWAGTPRPRGLR